MITEEDFAAVADCPPDLAFARLEKRFRTRLENNLENSQNNNTWAHYIIEYMNQTHAAAEALGLDFLDLFSIPDEDNTSNLHDIHNAFLRAVDNYTVRAHIRNVRHVRQLRCPSMSTTRNTSGPTSRRSRKLSKPPRWKSARKNPC